MQQAPVGDASMSQPMPQQDSMMNGTLDPQMGDPTMQDPSMGGDPTMQDPSMGGMEQPNMGGGNNDRKVKEIQKNIGKACYDFRQLDDETQEKQIPWLEGMLDSILDDAGEDGGEETEGEENPEQDMMPMEGTFTKKELKTLNEVFGDMTDTQKKEVENQKKTKKTTKSPFNNPTFN